VAKRSLQNPSEKGNPNGEATEFRFGANVDPDAEARDSALLKEAVENPGAAEVPEQVLTPEAAAGGEVPAASLDDLPGEQDSPLGSDPALMTARLSRPSPHTLVRLHPDRVLRTVLLAYKESNDASPEYYFVTEGLQRALRGELKQVRVHLVSEVSASGQPFLWVIPESNFSPYHAALEQIYARGETFVRAHVFRFERPDLKQRAYVPRYRALTPDDHLHPVPSRPVGKLLYEAMLPHNVIDKVSHPIYVALTSARRL
jgi:hypothetical protein